MSIDVEVKPAEPKVRRGGRWIDDWNPDDEEFWARTGRRIARKNLFFSIFAEHFGFAVWALWSVVVINLGNAGLSMTLAEMFWLTAVPNLIGATLRIPYTFAVPRFGGRMWTTMSASLLLIPSILLAFLVPSGWLAAQSHGTQFWVLLICAATAGFGGGNFSSSMANISFFYPEKHKGFALGMNAAGGNLGVAVVQIVVPLVVIVGVPAGAARLPQHEVHLAYAGLVWIPFVVTAAICAWLFMDSITDARSDARSYVSALRHGQTWIMSILYIGTFGSFIGYSFALPLVIKNTFPEFLAANPFVATYLAGLGFLGALIGSVVRPLGGWLSDRIGGSRVTLCCFIVMGLFTALAMVGVNEHSFPLFFASYMVIFMASGAANGSTYRMIPLIFSALGKKEVAEKGLDPAPTMLRYKREAAAVIGIAGAIGAFGGFLIQVVFRQSSLDVTAKVNAARTVADKLAVAQANADWSTSALWVFLGAYVVFAFLTWFFYLRKSFAVQRVPSLAYARV
ncbi:MAG TPA: MFS transporter [Actinophytocola sp.]|uniref:MFS transporter n=1 Tax=Actinophytocola sp. TaxID=1872138 RepID=UPI002DDD8030|nr:MFS transporter [Actinophytocola sp.]HEV2781279.1 MFS transporter [Actinophytocola sp.]